MKINREKVVGEYNTHMYLWNGCKELVKMGDEVSKQKEHRSLYYHMAGNLMAYLTYEAYLNFVGLRLLPKVWKNEREFFGRGKYRGIEGKLQLILEKCGIPTIDKGRRPYQTIAKLGNLRDFLVHGKPWIYGKIVEYGEDEKPDMFPDKFIYQECSPESAHHAAADVKKFIEYLHEWVLKKQSYHFPSKPLDMPLASASSKGVSQG